MLQPEREEKFQRVVRDRQPDITVVLENVHDPHNIGAVLRSCDSIGINQIFVLYTESHLLKRGLRMGKASSAGARKWVDVNFYKSRAACIKRLKKDYENILCSGIGEKEQGFHDVDFTQSMALVFGNEHAGVSPEFQEVADGYFRIPQVGMVESLNISVACAVTLYEVFRQRLVKGMYGNDLDFSPEQAALYKDYQNRHLRKISGRKVRRHE